MATSHNYVACRFPNGGIGDHLSCLVGAWYYALRTGRTLIVDWRGSRFNPDETQLRNCFEDYFEPLGTAGEVPCITDDRVAAMDWDGDYWPPKWTKALLSGSNHVVHSAEELSQTRRMVQSGQDVSARYVIFNSWLDPWPPKEPARRFFDTLAFTREVRAKVEAFQKSKGGDQPLIAIHVRHGNGENIGARAAYWLRPTSLVWQLLRNRRVSMHSGGIWGRFGDNMPESLVGRPAERGAERALFRRIAKSVNQLRKQPGLTDAKPLLFTDAGHIFGELAMVLPDLVSVSDRKESMDAGPLHQVVSTVDTVAGGIRTGTVPRDIAAEMIFEIALMRSCAALVCIDSGFTAITRTELDENRVISLQPSAVNTFILKVNNKL